MDFDPNCVCGGTKEKPQVDDCERCRFVVEVERLRAELGSANTKTHAEKQNRIVEVNGATRLLKESRDEVERLRAELALLRKDWCDDDEAIKQQALRVLDSAKVEGDSWSVPRMGSLAEMMADELLKVRAELAAVKAASVVPVEIMEVIYPTLSQMPYDTVIVARTFDDMCRFRNWLRERM